MVGEKKKAPKGKGDGDVEKVEATLKGAYELFKNNLVVFILAQVIVLVGSLFVITIPPLVFGLYCMALKGLRGKKLEIKDVFKGFDYLFTSWVMFLVGFIAIIVGLIFFVLPGLALMVLFNYAIAVAILENRGGIASLKRSVRVTLDNLEYSIILWVLIAILNGVGTRIPFAFLLTAPYTIIATSIAAVKLTGKQ